MDRELQELASIRIIRNKFNTKGADRLEEFQKENRNEKFKIEKITIDMSESEVNQNDRNKPVKETRTCNFCHKVGHIEKSCFKKNPKLKKPFKTNKISIVPFESNDETNELVINKIMLQRGINNQQVKVAGTINDTLLCMDIDTCAETSIISNNLVEKHGWKVTGERCRIKLADGHKSTLSNRTIPLRVKIGG
jgi:hypothetical protein